MIKGMEVADDIVWEPRNSADKPLRDQVMKRVRVETI